MPTRLANVVIDSPGPADLATWWGAALGWPVQHHEDETDVVPPAGVHAPDLVFVPVEDAKAVKNRVHLDVAPGMADVQSAEVARLLRAGAHEIEVGQETLPAATRTWVVLADPEDNEFCILSPRRLPS